MVFLRYTSVTFSNKNYINFFFLKKKNIKVFFSGSKNRVSF